ncbi:uncharacterized protein BKA55DRAFT_717724 [Fusarium redolens]|uniref:Amino acid transporter transmembrane domain-containing protein n=1 Tax=Fusarium redolens TaxID=48865 RepID=A0A9P9FXU0_FUSRE|nr:uncharacterized protein BKA55DRAFT_717724 [Fusarium redolens]KAH7220476.1 hypothetical protein BKA55DRAFT_717724 [Fusarium redolens]
MTAGAGMLTTSVGFNALSDHGACTIIFVALARIAAPIIGARFRALEKIAWVSWVGVACIIVSTWITATACLTQSRPGAGPSTSSIDLDIRVIPNTSFADAMTAILNQLFAVGASGVFFSIAAEIWEPAKFTRALICGQAFIVLTCIAIASIVYGNIGQYLASPALDQLGPCSRRCPTVLPCQVC